MSSHIWSSSENGWSLNFTTPSLWRKYFHIVTIHSIYIHIHQPCHSLSFDRIFALYLYINGWQYEQNVQFGYTSITHQKCFYMFCFLFWAFNMSMVMDSWWIQWQDMLCGACPKTNNLPIGGNAHIGTLKEYGVEMSNKVGQLAYKFEYYWQMEYIDLEMSTCGRCGDPPGISDFNLDAVYGHRIITGRYSAGSVSQSICHDVRLKDMKRCCCFIGHPCWYWVWCDALRKHVDGSMCTGNGDGWLLHETSNCFRITPTSCGRHDVPSTWWKCYSFRACQCTTSSRSHLQ